MLLSNKKIAIVGGGPGGLTLARLLQMKGVDVNVYERDINQDARVQGATLDLHEESGLAAIRAAGLWDEFKNNYRPGADKIRIVDQRGNIVFDDHGEKSNEDFGGEYFRPEIDRGPLRDILMDSLQPGTIVWNSHLQSIKPIGEKWELYFHNGTTVSADIVVGADGANSKVRSYITPIKAFYSGITIVEGIARDAATTVPRVNELLKGGKIFAFGDEKSLIVSSKGDGSVAFYTGCKTNESWMHDCGLDFKDQSQMLGWFKAEFSVWTDLWHELFSNSKTYFTPRPQYCMPLDQTWEANENITLIGDAAHLMPPYAGEGVNMAMLDALQLSECFINDDFGDLRAAIAHYENEMRKRTSETARVTLEQTESLHSKDAIKIMLEMFRS
jgi:2-polyprenyl-6-methoxyphenol hydroxylase-like FAD-dependent oxidoreductase